MIVVTVARKPLSEPTVAANALKHATGAMNIDATRVKFKDPSDEQETKGKNQIPAPMKNQVYGGWHKERPAYDPPGRWPANLVLSHLNGCRGGCLPGCPVAELDAQGAAQGFGVVSRFFFQAGGHRG